VDEEWVITVVGGPRCRTDGADVYLTMQLAADFFGEVEKLVDVGLPDN
jgi:hypothetical protein